MRLGAGASRSLVLHLGSSHQWYDFSVTVVAPKTLRATMGAGQYLRRYAGRVETGKPGFSDPAMA